MTTVELKIPARKRPAQSHCAPLPRSVLAQAKAAFTTRHVPLSACQTLLTGKLQPQAGDLVLARVDRIRQHARIELPSGRRARLFVDDLIVVAYGNRYAPDQFEGLVPDDLSACHLLAGGGVAGALRARSPKVKPPTEITPVGLLADADGQRLNTRDWLKPGVDPAAAAGAGRWDVPVLLVIGSSMNAGKTTTAARLIRGLAADGYRVGAMKVTGTGSGGDLWHFSDAGAFQAVDFTDAGHASTYRTSADTCLGIFHSLGDFLLAQGADALVVEVADGILQEETRALLQKPEFKRAISATWYCAGDSGSALFGVEWLKKQAYPLAAVSGVVSSNPLAAAEVQKAAAVNVVTKQDLIRAGSGHQLMQLYRQDCRAASQAACV